MNFVTSCSPPCWTLLKKPKNFITETICHHEGTVMQGRAQDLSDRGAQSWWKGQWCCKSPPEKGTFRVLRGKCGGSSPCSPPPCSRACSNVYTHLPATPYWVKILNHRKLWSQSFICVTYTPLAERLGGFHGKQLKSPRNWILPTGTQYDIFKWGVSEVQAVWTY